MVSAISPPTVAPTASLTTPHLPPRTTTTTASSGLGVTTPAATRRIDDDEAFQELYEQEQEQDDDYWDSDEIDEEWEMEQGLSSGINEVMDQDWADASGDFTKRYNRLKQHVVATQQPSSSQAASTSGPANVLPAINRSRRAQAGSGLSSMKTLGNALPGSSINESGAGVHLNKVSDQLAQFNSRYSNRLQLDPVFNVGGGSTGVTRKGGSEKVLIKDKADRATNEQVLDPRTRLILFKMLGRGLIERVDGCVSTGKEANVYHAITPPTPASEEGEKKENGESSGVHREAEPSEELGKQRHLALKIYKTSILIFKDRDRYVSGEFRFKSGYARSNPRKMVRLWAEKEMRNLRRMRTAGLRVPEPIEVRENVLVMEFMGAQEGDDEWQASPRLKDASIPSESLPSLYLEILVILRTIFQRCKLVHADFSEYNVLYHRGHLVVIDVSQSVEQDHPAAFDFLRSDLKNAEDFFARRGVDTLGLTRTFGYVTRKWGGQTEETDEDMVNEAKRLLDEHAEVDQEEEEEGADRQASTSRGSTTTTTRPSEVDEAVFAQSYIPRALDQVYDIERDVAKVLRGEGDGLIYADITGVAQIRKGEKRDEEEMRQGTLDEEEEESESGSEGSGSESGSDDEDDENGERRPRGKKFENKDEKKKRRAEVKAANREKRSHKMKKSEKARKVKKSSGKK